MLYSEKYNQAIPVILKHEGLFSNDPDDPGGATNYGISLRFLLSTGDLELGDIDNDGDIDIDDIKNMDINDAMAIYYKHWWAKYNYETISPREIAVKIFDMAVNLGAKQAHILVQRAVRACGIPLEEDGDLGPKSRAAITTIDNMAEDYALLAALRSEHAGFYRLLIAKKPVFEKYKKGWLRRAYGD